MGNAIARQHFAVQYCLLLSDVVQRAYLDPDKLSLQKPIGVYLF
jgi:hypothetical protein